MPSTRLHPGLTILIAIPIWCGVITGVGQTMALAQERVGPSTLTIPRLAHAPTLDDFAALEPAQSVNETMVRVEGLKQRTPRDGAPISERTTVYLGYNDTSLFAVFVCHDRLAGTIRTRLMNRDQIGADEDSVALQLDTFHDRKHAYGFQVNPLGVQKDGIWTEGKTWDFSFDTVWESEGRLTTNGYVVLITVPFKSLRFPPTPVQEWGILLFRGIPRTNEEAFWPQYSSTVAGRLQQAGTLNGLTIVSSGAHAQFAPYTSSSSSRSIDPHGQSDQFVDRRNDLNTGLDSKFIIRNNLVLDTTVNPDFSQVESDEPQATVNQRFEVFFPEKRPFFTENSSYFDTPINLLFTRRIRDPQMGARLTGKVGRYAVGALLTDDRSPERTGFSGDATGDGSALVGLVRVSRDLGRESSLGILSGVRRLDRRSNTVGGVDGRFKLGAKWVTAFQAVASATDLPDGRRLAGPAYQASLQRSGRTLLYSAQYDDRSSGFHTGAGFVSRVGIRELTQMMSYRFRPEGRRFVAWGPDLTVDDVWDHANRRLDGTYVGRLTGEFARQTTLSVSHTIKRERLRPSEFPVLSSSMDVVEPDDGVSFATSLIPHLGVSGQITSGTSANFLPVPSMRPFAAQRHAATLVVSVRAAKLTVDSSALFTQLGDASRSRFVFAERIVRTKWNYQFSRAWSLRTIVQLDAVSANPALTSLRSSQRLNSDLLLSYLPHPGSAIYVGYNHDLAGRDSTLTESAQINRRTLDRFINDSRQFFVKVSYLLRF